MVAYLGRYNKTPTERRQLKFDYSNWLCGNETLRNFNVEVVPQQDVEDPTPMTVDTVVVISPTVAKFFVQGGAEGFKYRLRVLASTSASQLKEDGVLFNITPGVSA